MNRTQNSPDIEERVRRALHTVAETVTGDVAASSRPTRTGRRPRRWRVAVGVGAVAIPLGVAAAAVVRVGPEYVDTIPPGRIVMSGNVDGSRYLLVESDRTDECGAPVTGVELVEEEENLFGREWDTTLYQYGELVEKRCGGHLNYVIDTSRYLDNPALFDDSGSEVGDSFVWVYSVHPDVTAVRVTSGDYSEELTVHEVDGAGYAAFEVPKDVEEYSTELLIGDQVVPGTRDVQVVPEPW